MKLRVASDLHFEFHADHGVCLINQLVTGDFDVLVVAGDLSNRAGFVSALAVLCEALGSRKLVYVLGNHEGYGGSWQSACEEAHRLEEELPNLVFLERSVAVIDQQRFVGCTLWYPHAGNVQPFDAMIMDFSEVQDVRRLLPVVAPASAKFLVDSVRESDVVVTHHLPHPKSIAAKFAHSKLNDYFLHDVSALVEQRSAALWIHGHTHVSCDYTVGSTRVLCNPFGYARHVAGEPNPHYRPDLDLRV
jgi:predicted phosphodiesterase